MMDIKDNGRELKVRYASEYKYPRPFLQEDEYGGTSVVMLDEILLHGDASNVDQSALNNDAPVFYNHDTSRMQIGVVKRAWVDTHERCSYAIIKFVDYTDLDEKYHTDEVRMAEALWHQVSTGIANNFSVGYRINEADIEYDLPNKCFYVKKRLDYEISLVTVPVDSSAKIMARSLPSSSKQEPASKELVMVRSFNPHSDNTTLLTVKKQDDNIKNIQHQHNMSDNQTGTNFMGQLSRHYQVYKEHGLREKSYDDIRSYFEGLDDQKKTEDIKNFERSLTDKSFIGLLSAFEKQSDNPKNDAIKSNILGDKPSFMRSFLTFLAIYKHCRGMEEDQVREWSKSREIEDGIVDDYLRTSHDSAFTSLADSLTSSDTRQDDNAIDAKSENTERGEAEDDKSQEVSRSDEMKEESKEEEKEEEEEKSESKYAENSRSMKNKFCDASKTIRNDILNTKQTQSANKITNKSPIMQEMEQIRSYVNKKNDPIANEVYSEIEKYGINMTFENFEKKVLDLSLQRGVKIDTKPTPSLSSIDKQNLEIENIANSILSHVVGSQDASRSVSLLDIVRSSSSELSNRNNNDLKIIIENNADLSNKIINAVSTAAMRCASCIQAEHFFGTKTKTIFSENNLVGGKRTALTDMVEQSYHTNIDVEAANFHDFANHMTRGTKFTPYSPQDIKRSILSIGQQRSAVLANTTSSFGILGSPDANIQLPAIMYQVTDLMAFMSRRFEVGAMNIETMVLAVQKTWSRAMNAINQGQTGVINSIHSVATGGKIQRFGQYYEVTREAMFVQPIAQTIYEMVADIINSWTITKNNVYFAPYFLGVDPLNDWNSVAMTYKQYYEVTDSNRIDTNKSLTKSFLNAIDGTLDLNDPNAYGTNLRNSKGLGNLTSVNIARAIQQLRRQALLVTKDGNSMARIDYDYTPSVFLVNQKLEYNLKNLLAQMSNAVNVNNLNYAAGSTPSSFLGSNVVPVAGIPIITFNGKDFNQYNDNNVPNIWVLGGNQGKYPTLYGIQRSGKSSLEVNQTLDVHKQAYSISAFTEDGYFTGTGLGFVVGVPDATPVVYMHELREMTLLCQKDQKDLDAMEKQAIASYKSSNNFDNTNDFFTEEEKLKVMNQYNNMMRTTLSAEKKSLFELYHMLIDGKTDKTSESFKIKLKDYKKQIAKLGKTFNILSDELSADEIKDIQALYMMHFDNENVADEATTRVNENLMKIERVNEASSKDFYSHGTIDVDKSLQNGCKITDERKSEEKVQELSNRNYKNHKEAIDKLK